VNKLSILITVILFTIIFILDFLPIIKSKMKLQIIVYGFIFIISFSILLIHESNINIPSPTLPLKYLIKNILNFK